MSTKCNSKIYSSLRYCNGKPTLPGIKKAVYFISADDIVKWPKLPSIEDAASMADIAVLVGDFGLAADAKWKRMDVLTTASEISSDSQGDTPSKTFINKINLKHAGRNEEATGFCRMANCDNLVYLVEQRDGGFRVIGNDKFETNTKPSQASGAKETDTSGTTIAVEGSDVCPAPFYKGKIETEDGDIDASTGEAAE